MRPTRALSLRREALTELGAADLAGLGAGHDACDLTCPIRDCPTDTLSRIFVDCLTFAVSCICTR